MQRKEKTEHHKSELCLQRRCCLSVWYLDWPLLGCGVCLSANPQISNRKHCWEPTDPWGMKYYLLLCIQLLPREPQQLQGFISSLSWGWGTAGHPLYQHHGPVCAWAPHSHLFDQQTQHLAEPHSSPSLSLLVCPWSHLLLPLAHSGKTWAKPHGGNRRSKHSQLTSQLHFVFPMLLHSLLRTVEWFLLNRLLEDDHATEMASALLLLSWGKYIAVFLPTVSVASA